MPGLFSAVSSGLFGEVGDIEESGAYQNVNRLGKDFSEFLIDRLNTNPADTETFKLGTEAIRDAVGGVAGAQRQQLGRAANTGGFLDSGAVTGGLSEIGRNELQSFASSERDLLLALIDRQDEGVFQYLSGAAGEAFNVASTNASIQGSNRDSSQKLFTDWFM